jgi:hypothetical protein
LAASGDVPESLLQARRALDEFGEVQIVQHWHRGVDGWLLQVDLTPGDLGTKFPIPATTSWYIVAQPQYPAGRIDILPAVRGGIVDTFPHQLPNIPAVAGLPYTLGKVCVATDSEGNLRSDRDVEPTAASDRLAWHVVRALGWIRRASLGTLLADGDWFELPFYRDGNGLVAFCEGPETFSLWRDIPDVAGMADVIYLGSSGFQVVTAFRSLGRKVLLRPEWGQAVVGPDRPQALWVRFPQVVSLPPYRAPRTIGELRAVAADQGVDLDRYLRDGTAGFHDRADHVLLAGFPVPVRVGEPDRQMHWQAIALPRLERKVINGFRPNPLGYWMTSSRGTLADERPLEWLMAENWHPDQLATRGRLDENLATRRIVLIGAGALGSMVGELLVRAGVRDITILDHDIVAAGNLVRHTLTLRDLGWNKAEALVRRLEAISPSVRPIAVPDRFPGDSLDARILGADLVIDTTGEHGVLDAMAEAAWTSRPTFASVAISMHARRLFAFLGQSDHFDVGAFDAAYGPYGREERDRDEERPWEGVGCWHPVFPARADEMWLMASAAVGLLESAWPVADGTQTLHVFERTTDAADRFTGLRKIAP